MTDQTDTVGIVIGEAMKVLLDLFMAKNGNAHDTGEQLAYENGHQWKLMS